MADLREFLARAYDHSYRGNLPDPAPECAAEIAREELEAKLAELRRVVVRCHVSKMHAAFIERVLVLR